MKENITEEVIIKMQYWKVFRAYCNAVNSNKCSDIISYCKNFYSYSKSIGWIDKEIIPFLDEINLLEGIATVFSCWGHAPHMYTGYLVCRFTDEKFKNMQENDYLCVGNEEMILSWEEVHDDEGKNNILRKFIDELKGLRNE